MLENHKNEGPLSAAVGPRTEKLISFLYLGGLNLPEEAQIKHGHSIARIVGFLIVLHLSGCENNTDAAEQKLADERQIKEDLSGWVATAQAGDPDAYISFLARDLDAWAWCILAITSSSSGLDVRAPGLR